MKCLLANKHIGVNTEGKDVPFQYADTCFKMKGSIEKA